MARKTRKERREAAKPSYCLALVPADVTLVRREQTELYQSRLKECTRHRELMKVFREIDTPAFSKWVREEFAELLQTSTEAATAVQELETKTQNVQNYALCQGIAEAEAFWALENAAAAGEEQTLWDEVKDRGDASEDESETLQVEFGEAPADENETASDDRPLKSLYRQLVRLLHPDRNPNPSIEDRQTWQDVLDAYAARDRLRLEALLATLTQGRARPADLASMPLGQLIELRREVEHSLGTLKIDVRKAKANPAWRFRALLKDRWRLSVLRSQIAQELQSEIDELESARLRLERKLASWSRAARPKRKASVRLPEAQA